MSARAGGSATATARSELPPSSKKLASTLTDAASTTPSTDANASRAALSSAERGATTAPPAEPAAALAASAAAGSRLRSILPLLVRGHASTPTTTDGTMYAGSADRKPPSDAARLNATAAVEPPPRSDAPSPSPLAALAGLTYATSDASPPPPSACASTTTASATPGCERSACSTSPSSSRCPRSFTCRSMRPPNSSSPSAYQRTRSPVRYATPRPRDDRSACGHGWATKRSAVSSGRRR